MTTTVSPFRFVVFCLAVLLGSMASAITWPILALQIDAVLAVEASIADLSRWNGWVFGIAPLAAALTLPIWLQIVRQGKGRAALIGIWALTGMVLAGLAEAYTAEQLVVLRLGLGCLGVAPLIAAAMAPRFGPPTSAGTRMTWVLLVAVVGIAIGAPLGGFMAKGIGLRLSFVVASMVSGAASLVLALGFPQPQLMPAPEAASHPLPAGTALAWRLGLLSAAAGWMAVLPHLPVHLMDTLGIDRAMAGIWSGLAFGAMTLSALLGGLLIVSSIAMYPLWRGFFAISVLSVLAPMMMARSGHVVDLIAWGVGWAYLVGAAFGLLLGAPQRLVPDAFRLEMVSRAWGWLLGGAAIGTALAGYLSAQSAGGLFTLAMGTSLLTSLSGLCIRETGEAAQPKGGSVSKPTFGPRR